nr:MAG TPA: hypothetical protein [Caudoviricetes sp.]
MVHRYGAPWTMNNDTSSSLEYHDWYSRGSMTHAIFLYNRDSLCDFYEVMTFSISNICKQRTCYGDLC